jgi:hypothetical protein
VLGGAAVAQSATHADHAGKTNDASHARHHDHPAQHDSHAARMPQPVMMAAPPLATPAEVMQAPTIDEPFAPPYAQPSSKKLWMILGSVAAVLLIAGGIIFFLTRNSDSSKAAAANGSPAAASTAILNFKVTHADAYGSLQFTFDTDPGTTRVTTMMACVGGDLKQLNDEIDPEYSDQPTAHSLSSNIRFCDVTKDSARPNGWTARVNLPIKPPFDRNGRSNAAPQRVAFAFRSDTQMISAPLIVDIDFNKKTSTAVALPANAPSARLSKVGLMSPRMASSGRGVGRNSDREAELDDFQGGQNYAEGPGSRGILAGDFHPVSGGSPRSGGVAGVSTGFSSPLDGRWRVLSVEGKPDKGEFIFSGDTMTLIFQGLRESTSIRVDAASSTLYIRNPKTGEEKSAQFEISGDLLHIYDPMGKGDRRKDEVILQRQ